MMVMALGETFLNDKSRLGGFDKMYHTDTLLCYLNNYLKKKLTLFLPSFFVCNFQNRAYITLEELIRIAWKDTVSNVTRMTHNIFNIQGKYKAVKWLRGLQG